MEKAIINKSNIHVMVKMRTPVPKGLQPCTPPLGYRSDKTTGRYQILVDNDVAVLVREAFYRAAEGKHPLRKILTIMTEHGLRSRTGKPLAISSFWKILTNPFYMGKLTYRGELYSGLHEPLVSQGCFDRVQSYLAKRKRS